MGRRPYTPADDAAITEMRGRGCTVQCIAGAIGRSRLGVSKRIGRLGLGKPRVDAELVIDLAGRGVKTAEIARLLGGGKTSVYLIRRAAKLTGRVGRPRKGK